MLKSIYRYSSISLSISLSLSLDRLGSSASTVSYLLYDQCHLCYYRHYSFIALSYLLRTQTNFLLKVIQSIGCSGPRYGQWTTLDPTFHSMGQKFTSRQRWTPSQTQLQILEKLFQQGNGTPSKQRIKEISVELSQYGQISETNVYNWFQNRRARTKRKQQAGGVNNAESEFDTDVDSQEEKKPRMDRDLSHDSLGAGHYATNSQNWGAAEHQPSDATRKGLESSQRLAAVEEFADADALSSMCTFNAKHKVICVFAV